MVGEEMVGFSRRRDNFTPFCGFDPVSNVETVNGQDLFKFSKGICMCI